MSDRRQKGKRHTKHGERRVVHLELLVEEASAGEALRPLLDKLARERRDGIVRPAIRQFRGKPDLLKHLPARLRGYAAARRRGDDVRVVVLVDRDDDDCAALKKRMDTLARDAGLAPSGNQATDGGFHVLNRIAVRELESWYFGDWGAVRAGFPKAPSDVPRAYRGNPDLAAGKCSDVFEKVLRSGGVRLASKPEWGRRIGPHLDPDGNRSPSFRSFVTGVRAILAR